MRRCLALRLLCALLLSLICCAAPVRPFSFNPRRLQTQAVQLHASLVALQRQRGGRSLRVAVVGDSLLRQQTNLLCLALEQRRVPGPALLKHLSGGYRQPHTCAGLNITVAFAPADCGNTEALDGVLRAVNATSAADAPTRFDVLYYDAGLHFLHLGRTRNMGCFVPTERNIKRMVDSLLRAARERLGAHRTVLFTAHAVCTERWDGDYAAAIALHRRDPDALKMQCMLHVHGLAHAAAENACARATFNNDGVRYVNALVVNATRAAAPDVRVIDGYALTRDACWASKEGDGRHYPALLPDEVARLLEQLRDVP